MLQLLYGQLYRAFPHRRMLIVRILPDFENNCKSPAHRANDSFKETAISYCSYTRDELTLLKPDVGWFTWITGKPQRGSKFREIHVLDAYLNYPGLLCLMGCSSSSSQAIFDVFLVLLILFTIPGIFDSCRWKKPHPNRNKKNKPNNQKQTNPPLQPIAVCCISPGCYLLPALK